MAEIRTGYQPTSAPTVRRADYDVLRRIAELERKIDAYGLRGSHGSWSFNANTSSPPTGNQLRLNNASQTAATHMYLSHTTFDGMSVSQGLANIQQGHLIYFQDFDDATKWVRYTVSGPPVTHSSWTDFPITFESGPANVPFQKIELQPTFPNATA